MPPDVLDLREVSAATPQPSDRTQPKSDGTAVLDYAIPQAKRALAEQNFSISTASASRVGAATEQPDPDLVVPLPGRDHPTEIAETEPLRDQETDLVPFIPGRKTPETGSNAPGDSSIQPFRQVKSEGHKAHVDIVGNPHALDRDAARAELPIQSPDMVAAPPAAPARLSSPSFWSWSVHDRPAETNAKTQNPAEAFVPMPQFEGQRLEDQTFGPTRPDSASAGSAVAAPTGEPRLDQNSAVPPDMPREAAAHEIRDRAPSAPERIASTPAATSEPVAPHRQLADAIIRSKDGQIEVVLDPVELGRVTVILGTEAHPARIGLIAERPETLDLLRRHGDQLIRDLRDSGMPDAQMDFMRQDRGGGGHMQGNGRDGARPTYRQQGGTEAKIEALPPPVTRPNGRLDIRL